MVDFGIETSAEKAREMLENHCGKNFSRTAWKGIVGGYKREKARLIGALDPITARKEFPFRWEAGPNDKVDQWMKALSECYERADNLQNNSFPRDDSARERLNKRISALRASSPYLRLMTNHVLTAELETEKVRSDGLANAFSVCKRGQSLSRAIGAYLRNSGIDSDAAALVVDDCVQAAQVKPREGKLVLSANILDILLVSENCSWSSCLNFKGCHCAGPQWYLQDNHSIVAYYYEKEVNNLPKKLFRQMVYIDHKRHSAALQRHYGQTMPDSFHALARKEIACLLARLKGQEGEPKWYRCKPNDVGIEVTEESGVYVDETRGVIQLKSGNSYRPRIVLAEECSCPACNGDHDKKDGFVCKDCSETRITCDRCNCRLSEDDSHSDGSGNSYCDDCYSEIYTSCEACGTALAREDASPTHNDDPYCQRCFDRRYFVCDSCEESFPRDDRHSITRADGDCDGPFCETCYFDNSANCYECDETMHVDDMDNGLCPCCAPPALVTTGSEHNYATV